MTTKHLQELSGSFLAQLPPASVGGVWPSCSPEAPGVIGDSLRQSGGEMFTDPPPHLETGPGSPQPPPLSLPAWTRDTARKHFWLWSLLTSPYSGGSKIKDIYTIKTKMLLLASFYSIVVVVGMHKAHKDVTWCNEKLLWHVFCREDVCYRQSDDFCFNKYN